jgi:fructose/tagatose bisphosphate aldolase
MEFGGLCYVHTSCLPRGRCEWLNSLIANRDYDLAVSVDSDSQFDGTQLAAAMEIMMQSDAAIGVVPMAIGGTHGKMLNVSLGNERLAAGRVAKMFKAETLPLISAGGFGVTVFRLDWFRENWHLVSPERQLINYDHGEDIEMCLAVGRRGGRTVMLRVDSKHHDLIAAERQSLTW